MQSGKIISAPVFGIQHCCLHDGPGIRSTVFLKGCPLRCQWCQNPESWESSPQIIFKPDHCIDCRLCTTNCPNNAIVDPGNRLIERCNNCGLCSENCPGDALSITGEKMTPDQLINDLLPEMPNYNRTGGGITFSGGEAGLYPAFLGDVIHELRQKNIHTAIETCGVWANNSLESNVFFNGLDIILFDLKIFSNEEHRRFCGRGNKIIKNNFTRLAIRYHSGEGPPVWPRIPLIPNITDTDINIISWAEFLINSGIKYVTLVPYHNLGDGKRKWLGMPKAYEYLEMTEDRINIIINIFDDYGIRAVKPGNENWDNVNHLGWV